MEKITAEKVSFLQAAPYLTKSLSGDDQVLRQQCDAGIAQCWRLQGGQAYMLTRSEKKELVVCCFEGKNLGEVISGVIFAAKRCGFTSIRFHTKRPAILKLLKQEFSLVENIYRRKL